MFCTRKKKIPFSIQKAVKWIGQNVGIIQIGPRMRLQTTLGMMTLIKIIEF